MELLDQPATPLRLRQLAAAGQLDAATLESALRRIGRRPTAASWHRFARGHLLGLGAVLLAAGVVFFVAANWSHLSSEARLGLVGASLLAATLAAAVLGLEGLGGRVATLLAGLLFGPLMALYGQTYQTGADAWELFGAWTLVFTAFAAIARLTAGWVAWLVLVHVAAFTFYAQYVNSSELFSASGLPVVIALALFDAGVMLVLERRSPRPAALVDAAATFGVALLVDAALWAIVDQHFGRGALRLAAVLLAVVALALLTWLYRQRIPDLYLLFVAASGGCILLSTALGKLLWSEWKVDSAAAFLLHGLAICAQVWLLGRWLLAWRRDPVHDGEAG